MDPSADDDQPEAPTAPNPLPDGVGPIDRPAAEPTPEMRELVEATAADREEVRRMVEAGASSPEDLRALAEKIREQREREQQVWDAKVKPSLHDARKPTYRLSSLRSESTLDRTAERRFLWIAGISVFLVLLVLTLSSTPLVVIAFLLAILLAYAYASGRKADGSPAGGEEAPPSDPAEGEPEA